MLIKQTDSTTLKYLVFECMVFMQNMVFQGFLTCPSCNWSNTRALSQIDFLLRIRAFLGLFCPDFYSDI